MVAASYMIAERLKSFMVFMLFLETAVLGVFMSINLFLFFVFWEAMLIPSYFLLGIWGEERRVYATTKFVVYTVAGSFLMLVGVFYLWAQTQTLDMVGPNGLIAHPVSSTAQTWLFLAFGLAFAIKIPIWPFHTWAPTAYTESPAPFLLVLAGILSKAGAFGFIRYNLPLFPVASRQLAGLVSVLAIIGMLYAATLALVQTDTKRVVAYSSISHMNLIALGIFALNGTGLDGSVLQMINHSVIITGLFLAVVFIAARSGTRLIPRMGGFKANAWFSSIAALTVILAAWYMIRLFQTTMNGPPTTPSQPEATTDDDIHTVYQYPVVRRLIRGDIFPREALLWIPLIPLIFYIGIQPDSLTTRMNPTTNQVTTLVHQHNNVTNLGAGR
jgi:NADH-quinone oxidoreductase subunit M